MSCQIWGKTTKTKTSQQAHCKGWVQLEVTAHCKGWVQLEVTAHCKDEYN